MRLKHTTNGWLLAVLLLATTGATARAASSPFATFSDTAANQWHYSGGTITSGTATANFVSFGPANQVLNYTGGVTYTLNATATGAPTTTAGVISQAMSGDITFKHGSVTVLDVVFSGAIFSGSANSTSSGLSDDTGISGQVISYSSDPSVKVGTFATPYSFSFSLTQIPGISISGGNLADFTATASGSFASSVPEPASLSMLGIAAVALLRRRVKRC